MPLETSFFLIQRSLSNADYTWPPMIKRDPEAITPKSLDDFVRRMRG